MIACLYCSYKCFWFIGCSFEDFIRKNYEPFQPVTTPPYQLPLLCGNPVDPQLARSVYYSPIAPLSISHTGLVQSYPMTSTPCFILQSLPTNTFGPYTGEPISPYSSPVAIQPSTPPTQLPNNEMIKAFENITVSSPSIFPQDDIQQPVTHIKTVTKDTVSEWSNNWTQRLLQFSISQSFIKKYCVTIEMCKLL